MAKVEASNPLLSNLSGNNTPNSADRTNPNSVIYVADVVEIYPVNYTVAISACGANAGTTMGVVVGNILSNLLGLSFKTFPSIGQKVLVLKNTSLNPGFDFVLGSLPDTASTADFMTSTNHIGMDSTAAYAGTKDQNKAASILSGVNANNGTYPIDMIDGEGSISMAGGPGIDFLTNLVRLKSTDLAKIECYVLDDFIRILSQNFEQISAFGDYKIINNNGALDVIWSGSCYEYESTGESQPNIPRVDGVKGNVIPTYGADDEQFYADGRWRFQNYIGKLGGFIHTFITDPERMLKGTNETSNSTGRCSLHCNNDGSFLLQSIGDIVLEKVVRIPVPLWECRPEELAETITKVDAYEQWVPNSGNDSLYETSYKFKDYGRWLANYYAVAAFQGLQDSVSINSENDTPAPSVTLGDETAAKSKYKALENAFGIYLTRYATIRIFRDGSILLLDGYGSSVHLSGRDVSISATRDLLLNAAGNVNITGSDINMISKDAIDITGTQRGVMIKGHQWVNIKSDIGSVSLESDASLDNYDGNIKDYNGNDVEDIYGKEKHQKAYGSGIILKTSGSNILIDAGYKGIIINCLDYLNRALNVYYKAYNFIIDKIASFSLGKFICTSGMVEMQSIMANSISNRGYKVVSITGQPGLTSHHDDDKLEYDQVELKSRMEDLVFANDKLKEFYDENMASEFKFEYRTPDNLTPNYRSSYQNVSQQWLKDHDDGKDGSDGTIFTEDDYGGQEVSWMSLKGYITNAGTPVYPSKQMSQKNYQSKLDVPINGLTSLKGQALKPSSLQGNFISTIPSSIYHNPEKYK